MRPEITLLAVNVGFTESGSFVGLCSVHPNTFIGYNSVATLVAGLKEVGSAGAVLVKL